MKSQRLVLKLGLVTWMIAAVVAVAPVASAAGSGYSLTFTQSAGQSSDPAVDLTSLSTSDPGGAQIVVTIQVSGAFNLHDSNYGYKVYFGGSGSAAGNTASAVFSNETTGFWVSSGGAGGAGTLTYTLGGGGSTLTFDMNKTAVGPSTAFSANAFADSDSTNSFSWIGTDYVNNGGGSTNNCALTSSCPAAAGAALAFGVLLGLAIVGIIVVIVVVLVVVMVMRRRKPPMTQTMPGQPPMSMGNPPPPPPPLSP